MPLHILGSFLRLSLWRLPSLRCPPHVIYRNIQQVQRFASPAPLKSAKYCTNALPPKSRPTLPPKSTASCPLQLAPSRLQAVAPFTLLSRRAASALRGTSISVGVALASPCTE